MSIQGTESVRESTGSESLSSSKQERSNTSDAGKASTDSTFTTGGEKSDLDPDVENEKRRRRDVLRHELSKMQERDKDARDRRKAHREEENKKAKEKMMREKVEKGIAILPESRESRGFVKHIVKEESKVALDYQRKDLDAETTRMTSYIDHKLGISALPRGKELQDLAEGFYRGDNNPNNSIPEHVRRQLTTEEINDFRVVFDMFDAKNKGYITAEDLKRAAAMLGYAAKKKVFREMIDSIAKDKKGRVTFFNFLDLVVKLQGDGPDPHEDITQFFRLLDKGNKGYVTFQDIRTAADELKISLSNRAIREMMQEANTTGNGKITLNEFKEILSQTGTFRAFVLPP